MSLARAAGRRLTPLRCLLSRHAASASLDFAAFFTLARCLRLIADYFAIDVDFRDAMPPLIFAACLHGCPLMPLLIAAAVDDAAADIMMPPPMIVAASSASPCSALRGAACAMPRYCFTALIADVARY